MKHGDEGYMWLKIEPDQWQVRLVEVEEVTDRGTLFVTVDGERFYETSGLHIYAHRWECAETTPVPHGEEMREIK